MNPESSVTDTSATETPNQSAGPVTVEVEARETRGVSLTEKAALHVRDYLSKRGKGVGIRLAVKTTGCSGLMYVLEPVDEELGEDLKFVSQGVDVFVDPKSLIYIDGTRMDYVKQGLNEGFEFQNPNVQGECGCGESFTV